MKLAQVFGLLIFVAGASPFSEAFAAELGRSDAKKLLGYMGCANANVAAIINGAGPAMSGPNVAFVAAVCDRNGKATADEWLFVYDNDVGWLHYELNKEAGLVRVWTTKGYGEVRRSAP